MVSFILSHYCRRLRQTVMRQWEALSAGVAVAYVFIGVIPELEEHKSTIAASAAANGLDVEKRVYLYALAGFIAFVGLNHLKSHGGAYILALARSEVIYWVEICGYSLYVLLISFLLVHREDPTIASLGLFVFAMGFHLFMIDSQLAHQLGPSYDRWGRIILILSVPLGWGLGIAEALPDSFTSRLFAFILGGVVVLSAYEELPSDSGRFGWFLSGAFCYAIILMLV
jgi:hypothetical protein